MNEHLKLIPTAVEEHIAELNQSNQQMEDLLYDIALSITDTEGEGPWLPASLTQRVSDHISRNLT